MALLAGGMALFTLGDVFFRRVMSMRPLAVRFLGAVAAMLLGIAGMSWGAFAAVEGVPAATVIC